MAHSKLNEGEDLELKKRIPGKRFEHIYFTGKSAAIRFTDSSVLTVHTRVSCDLVAGDGNLVTECTFTDTKAEIRLGSNSVIKISMDEDDLVGAEFFQFDDDVDGAWIVVN